MPDLIPDPLPSSPTKPPLTAEMIQSAKDTGTPRPGAGGWVPSTGTILAIGAVGTTFGALAASLPGLIPGRVGLICGAVSGAIAGGCVFFAAKSAGPRSPTS